jgi:hypothetical protein
MSQTTIVTAMVVGPRKLRFRFFPFPSFCFNFHYPVYKLNLKETSGVRSVRRRPFPFTGPEVGPGAGRVVVTGHGVTAHASLRLRL